MSNLSIIIVTYNSSEYIIKCIDSIYLHIDVNIFEIIVVDNSSQHESNKLYEIISSKYKEIIFVRNENNSGYGDGNNLGIKLSSGDIICIMNPDVIQVESLFKYTIKEFESHDDLAMLGYKQIGGKNLSFYIRQEFHFPIFTSLIVKFCNRFNLFNKKYMYLSGAFFFTRKDYFYEIGLFDPNFFLYCEESDVTKRFLEKKYNIKYEKNLKYIHDIDKRNEISESGFDVLLNSTSYYFRKFSFNFTGFLCKLSCEIKFKKLTAFVFKQREQYKIMQSYIDKINKYKSIEK